MSNFLGSVHCGESPATPPTAVNPAKAGSSFFSSKRTVLQNVMLMKISIGCPH